METVATVLYARLRNTLAICNAMTPERSAEFVTELRGVLEEQIARQNGIVAMVRPDSILAVFSNEPEVPPDHARRGLHAALLVVYGCMELSKRLAARTPGLSVPPLSLAVGVHIGRLDVRLGRKGSSSGLIRATGEAVEIARALESAAPDLRWGIVASGAARRAAGARIESAGIGSVELPDGSFIDVAKITGLAPTPTSKSSPEVYQALREAVRSNASRFDRARELPGGPQDGSRIATLFAIEGYRVLRKIGEGGMAAIHLAEAGPRNELQVLKVMSMAGSPGDDPLHRFMQEFALLAQVRHPNIVKIHRQDFSAGHAYIAMEYFHHGDLRARIAQGVTPEEALSFVKQIAAALGAIHRAGIVHRDLKPENLMLRGDGSVALTDFGIAKHLSILITDTAHDEVVGSPYYLSPEQAMGQTVDQRCDFYSLGVMFYELMAGDKPYRARTAEELLDLHVNAPVPLLPPPHQHLQPVLERLMAKDRELRYGDAQEFLDELGALEVFRKPAELQCTESY
jgi:class 3 adenylate cyclase